MRPFILTLGYVGPVVPGMMSLSLFFKLLGRLEARAAVRNPASVSRRGVRGVFDSEAPAVVHMTNGQVFKGVRIAGFTRAAKSDVDTPFEPRGMVILEHADGRRTMVKPKHIQSIEVAAANWA